MTVKRHVSVCVFPCSTESEPVWSECVCLSLYVTSYLQRQRAAAASQRWLPVRPAETLPPRRRPPPAAAREYRNGTDKGLLIPQPCWYGIIEWRSASPEPQTGGSAARRTSARPSADCRGEPRGVCESSLGPDQNFNTCQIMYLWCFYEFKK